jgi:hypothetical protein
VTEKQKRAAILVMESALRDEFLQLCFAVGRLKVQLGRFPRVRYWARGKPGPRRQFGHNLVLPFDWIETVLDAGLVRMGTFIVLQATPIDPEPPAEAAWDVLHVQCGNRMIGPCDAAAVRYGGLTRLAADQNFAIELCIREYRHLLGLEPTPLPF